MQDRRQSVRDKVLYGGVAGIKAAARWIAWSAISANTAPASSSVPGPGCPDDIELTIARKGRSFLARIIWRQANRLRLAFRTMIADSHESDLDARLRRNEKKKQQLQRRINELLGEG